ncbi:uncharacterized protein LOC143141023 [Alosa pseudoharengus]|uniref:uncharacterized protein LOC143141023 n=1 Tax=Alosa pseudoharengus TaxID=34774 RepID=UPI003F894A87
MREEVTREVQREMRLERRWVDSKINKEKKREERIQGKLKKVKKTVKSKSTNESQEGLSSEDPHLPPEETEKRIGGQGEPSQSLDVSSSLPASSKVPSPRGDLTAKLCERWEELEHGVGKTASPQKSSCQHSPPHADLDLIFPLTPNDRVRSSRQNSPERNISLVKQHLFSDAKKKLSEICQKLVIQPSTSPRPASACGIIRGKMPSAEQISSCLIDIQQTLLENHFKGMVTSEELQIVLRGMVVTLVEEVNNILIPAITAFEYERVLPANSPKDLSSCYDTSSTTSKISPVTSSSQCSMSEVHVTYPNYMLPNSRGASRVELWSASSPEDGQDNDRRSLRKKVVAPTAGLLLKVENLIKDIIKDSVDGTATVSIAKCAEDKAESDAKIQETKPEDERAMEVGAEMCCMVSPETTDNPTAVTINTTTAVTIADPIATTDKTAVVTMNTTTTLVSMDITTTAVTTDATASFTMETSTTAVTTEATAVVAIDTTSADNDFSSDRHLVEQSSDNIGKDSEQQLEANDVMSDHPEFSGSEESHVTKEAYDCESTSSDASSGFVVSLEKSILLSSDQVDEILEKMTFALEEERPCSWLPSSPEDKHKDAEAVSPPPNSVIFAILQKMQLDKYLQRKLMSFFVGRQMTSLGSPSMSPMAASSHPGAQESVSWSSLSEINPHSIKVTKWLLQTIQRRNSWEGSMTSDKQEMDGQQFREKHLVCEVIQALLDHLNDVSATRSLSRQTQSESDVCAGVTAQGGPVHVDAVVSDTSIAACEFTKDIVSKLLLEDNSP